LRALKVHLDQLFEETGFDGDDPLVLEEAIESFKRGGPALLDRATPYLCDYYRSTASEFTPEQRRSCGIPGDPKLGRHLGGRPVPLATRSNAWR
jgi:hypothetical protein